jgi:hypothetical protein
LSTVTTHREVFMPTANVNGLAVLIAAMLTFAIGWAWYSPLLFAKAWMQANAYTPERLETLRKGAMRAYSVSMLCYLVMAYVLALFISYVGATTLAQGLWIGFLAWLGFAATVGLTGAMFTQRPLAAWVIDAGYQLTHLLVMAVILTKWR